MNPHPRLRLVGTALALLLALPGSLSATASPAAQPSDAAPVARSSAASGITTSGSRILRNGKNFVARGVVFEGFQFPLQAMQSCFDDPDTYTTTKPGTPARTQALEFCRKRLLSDDYYFGTRWDDQSGRPRPEPSVDYGTDGTDGIANDALTRARRDWNVNLVRFNVNQALLDPQAELSGLSDPSATTCGGTSAMTRGTWGCSYTSRLRAAVDAARAKNMVVVIALFGGRLPGADDIVLKPGDDRSLNDYNGESGLNTGRSLRAMTTLGSLFASDTSVVMETYNEPQRPETAPASLDVQGCYVSGCRYRATDGSGTKTVMGVNELLRRSRSQAGITTPIIVQSIGPDLSTLRYGSIDAALRAHVIFASHPFLRNGNRRNTVSKPTGSLADWNTWLNRMRTKNGRPVMITAWEAKTMQKANGNNPNNTWCTADRQGVKLPRAFIGYVKNQGFGLVGFAFDGPGSIIRNFRKPTVAGQPSAGSFNPDRPSTLPVSNAANAAAQRKLCQRGNNAGEAMQNLFRSLKG